MSTDGPAGKRLRRIIAAVLIAASIAAVPVALVSFLTACKCMPTNN